MAGEISDELREWVGERAYHVCEYCLVQEEDLYHGCEVDHIISRKHGGVNTFENLALACFHCNRHKATDLSSIHPRTGKLVRLFNPRKDRWSDHFYIYAGRIEASTGIGEVTARLLEFNHLERVSLRALLFDSGRYPSLRALARMKE